jgi:hypothetical protein
MIIPTFADCVNDGPYAGYFLSCIVTIHGFWGRDSNGYVKNSIGDHI